jgi:nicotinate dehydrogenase subunit A
MMASYSLTVNGGTHAVESRDPDQPLLYVLRNALGLGGPKFGCGLGQCGACTVIADGSPIRSCQMPVSAAQGLTITTIEGLGSPKSPIRSRQLSSPSRRPNAAIAPTAWS